MKPGFSISDGIGCVPLVWRDPGPVVQSMRSRNRPPETTTGFEKRGDIVRSGLLRGRVRSI